MIFLVVVLNWYNWMSITVRNCFASFLPLLSPPPPSPPLLCIILVVINFESPLVYLVAVQIRDRLGQLIQCFVAKRMCLVDSCGLVGDESVYWCISVTPHSYRMSWDMKCVLPLLK